jgi:hypothetical protein
MMWLHDNEMNVERLTTSVEHHLHQRGVTAEFAHALATCSMRGHLAKLNGNANLIPPKRQLVQEAISLLTNDFARAVYAADINQVSMFLDDFYHLVRNTPPKDRIALAEALRGLAIDGGVAHFSVQFNLFNWIAVMHTQTAPKFRDAWDGKDMHNIAPLNFDAANSVVLHALPVAQGPAMLEAYLQSQRLRKMPNGPYPFTAEALTAIVQIAAGDAMTLPGTYEPRNLLQVANRVTSKALDLNMQAPIGPEFVAHVLQGAPSPSIAAPNTGGEEEEPNTGQQLGPAVPCPCACHSDEESDAAYDVVATIEGGTGRVLGYSCGNCTKEIADIAVPQPTAIRS